MASRALYGTVCLIRLMALIPEAIYLDSSLTWHSETCFIGNWLIDAVGFAVKFNNRCLDPISRNSVLVMFNVSLLAASQTRILSKSRLIQLFISSASLPAKVILVSSAYILGCIWRAREPPEKKKRPQMCRLSHFVLNDLVLSLLSLKCPFRPVLCFFFVLCN